MDWSTLRVMVTSGIGFFGQHVVRELGQCGCRGIFVPRHAEYDLCYEDEVVRAYRDAQPHRDDCSVHWLQRSGDMGYEQTERTAAPETGHTSRKGTLWLRGCRDV